LLIFLNFEMCVYIFCKIIRISQFYKFDLWEKKCLIYKKISLLTFRFSFFFIFYLLSYYTCVRACVCVAFAALFFKYKMKIASTRWNLVEIFLSRYIPVEYGVLHPEVLLNCQMDELHLRSRQFLKWNFGNAT